MSTAKEKNRVQRRLGQLWMAHPPGRCWVCNSRYDQLSAQLVKLNTQKS